MIALNDVQSLSFLLVDFGFVFSVTVLACESSLQTINSWETAEKGTVCLHWYQ